MDFYRSCDDPFHEFECDWHGDKSAPKPDSGVQQPPGKRNRLMWCSAGSLHLI